MTTSLVTHPNVLSKTKCATLKTRARTDQMRKCAARATLREEDAAGLMTRVRTSSGRMLRAVRGIGTTNLLMIIPSVTTQVSESYRG